MWDSDTDVDTVGLARTAALSALPDLVHAAGLLSDMERMKERGTYQARAAASAVQSLSLAIASTGDALQAMTAPGVTDDD